VKLLQKTAEGFIFQTNAKEKALLKQILNCYPILPISYTKDRHRASGQPPETDRHLLDEALAQQKKETAAWVARLFHDDQLMGSVSAERVYLEQAHLEMLLQVLNDLRVGSWVLLGSPDEKVRPKLSPTNARHFWIMELAGHFETLLLRALDPDFTSFASQL